MLGAPSCDRSGSKLITRPLLAGNLAQHSLSARRQQDVVELDLQALESQANAGNSRAVSEANFFHGIPILNSMSEDRQGHLPWTSGPPFAGQGTAPAQRFQ